MEIKISQLDDASRKNSRYVGWRYTVVNTIILLFVMSRSMSERSSRSSVPVVATLTSEVSSCMCTVLW